MRLIKPQIIGITEQKDSAIYTFGQNTGRILQRNKQDRHNSTENWKKDDDLKLAARIPKATWLLWESMGITNDEKELFRAIERNKEYKTTEKQLI